MQLNLESKIKNVSCEMASDEIDEGRK